MANDGGYRPVVDIERLGFSVVFCAHSGRDISRTRVLALSRPGRSAAFLQRCAAEPGPTSAAACCVAFLDPGSTQQRFTLQRVRDTRENVRGAVAALAPTPGGWLPATFPEAFRNVKALASAQTRREAQIKTGPERAPQNSAAFSRSYLILASRNSTCLRATGSYFFLTILSVMVREFFLAT
jgi:hypothetical protein